MFGTIRQREKNNKSKYKNLMATWKDLDFLDFELEQDKAYIYLMTER